MSGRARIMHARTTMARPLPGLRQAWRDLLYFPPIRRLGVVLWNKWLTYSVDVGSGAGENATRMGTSLTGKTSS